jgi:uncharacterized protein affecting Mg2+/Co2+ transport
MSIGYYRKKPVVIEAIRYDGTNSEQLRSWSDGAVIQSPVLEPSEEYKDGSYVQIKTLEGVMTAIIGDWIIKGVHGEYYPCKNDIFRKTYDFESEKPNQ